MKETKIALGTWAWGTGMFGGDTVFDAALDRYHASPMMGEAAALREKYKLGGRQIRRFTPIPDF